MPLGASRTNFLPDTKLLVRNSGQGALAATFNGPSFDLARLAGYWSVDELGLARLLQFAVNVEALSVAGAQSYEFRLEIDDNSAFSSPTTVASQVISTVAADGTLPLYFDLNLERQFLLMSDHTASFVRLKMIPTGTLESGSLPFTAVATANDTVTISDGVNTVVFTFQAAGNGATGVAVNVAVGATATNSAQNLKTAIAANLSLVGIVASGGAATLTVTHAYTGGSLAAVSASVTPVNFSGGADPSIKFWSFIRGSHAMGA